jgi:murein L,D-transpeptidase YcbB/YkuD
MQFGQSKKNFNSGPANQGKGSLGGRNLWAANGQYGARLPARSVARHSICGRRWHCRSGHVAGIGQRHVVGIGKSKYVSIWAVLRRRAMAEPNLQKGSTDPAVRDLQEALKALGYNPGPIDGVFGDTTEAAVKAFQQARGITTDGIVGKVTWINIDEADQSEPVLKIGSTGLPVRRAQKRMSLVGYDVGGVDGRYGTSTEAAVKMLQQQRGLAVDGVVGPQTWSVIDALENEGPVS